MKNYKYKISNIDCAACANKVEKHLNKDDQLNDVIINFSKLTISFKTDIEEPKEYVEKKANEVEEIKLINMDEELEEHSIKGDLIRLIVGSILALLGLFYFTEPAKEIIIIISYLILLDEIIMEALSKLLKKEIDEHLLITIAALGAYFIGSIGEGLMVVILYEIGEILEHLAVNHTRKSISKLATIKPEYANKKINGDIQKLPPEEINIDDIIIVKRGEKVPLDGIVIKGESYLDTSAITGESNKKPITVNDNILSGCINTGDILEIKVTNTYENSTVASILNLVENASDKKTKTEKFVSKFASIYTPIIIILAILVLITFPPLLDISFREALYKSLTFLVISCPCAIAISIPLSYFASLGASSKEGVLIKGSNYIDTLNNLNKIIFDKTGTITTSEIKEFKLTILNDKYKKEDIINYYLLGEQYSNHPLAKSIINFFNKKIPSKDITNYQEISGKGITYKIKKDTILIGSSEYTKSNTKDNAIYLSINNNLVAKLDREDTIKSNAKDTINKLNKLGIKTLMFTGDEEKIAKSIAAKIGINEVKYELLPKDKYNLLENELNNSTVAFVGDGINDAPSLTRADIGISMGAVGSQEAIEASDIVITNDDLSKILKALKIAKKTRRIIIENLAFALSIKVIVLILSILGISTMWQAVFADTGVTLLTVINSARILNTKKDQ